MTYKIKENAKNVWIRNNENTQDLSPLTDANSVYFNNGRTLEQELGKGAMESNVVTIDSTMSKVIDEAYDGVYESCVFKGKSLVNLGREIDSQYYNISGEGTQITSDGYFKIPYAGSENSHSVRLKFGLLEPLIKPDTVYSLIVEIAENTTQNARIGFTGHNNLSCVEPVDKNTNIASAVGTHVKLIKRRSEVTARQSDLYFCIWDKTNVDATKHIKFRYMILEGDWTNKELPPFFTGIGYAKMPILRNIGKNLFNPTVPTPHHMVCNGVTDGGLVGVIPVKPNTTYTLSVKKDTTKGRFIAKMSNRLLTSQDVSSFSQSSVYNYLRDNYANGRKFEYTIHNQKSLTFTTLDDCHYIYVNVDRSFGTTTANEILVFSEMTLEESPTQTTYEDHKTNILRTPEEIVLREVNGVQDTYNAITGEYVQRIGERDYIEGDFTDVNVKTDGVKTQYELTEPVTTIVEPSTIPFIYQNGHIILESGYKGQSLTPILEYTASVSRTGQVENVAKTIQRHETQLTLLEKMLIGNIIELDYNNTLMALNLKMDEVK